MDIDERIKKLASWYYDRLLRGKRTNGDTYYCFRARVSEDGTGDERLPPHEDERCRALSLAAHNDGDMLPDDWRYEFINEALGAIVEASDLDEIEMEPDIYNHELINWLGSHGQRSGYCDEAVSEGLCAGEADTITRLSCGQYMEKREVLAAVLHHLREEAEADEAEEEVQEEATDEA